MSGIEQLSTSTTPIELKNHKLEPKKPDKDEKSKNPSETTNVILENENRTMNFGIQKHSISEIRKIIKSKKNENPNLRKSDLILGLEREINVKLDAEITSQTAELHPSFRDEIENQDEVKKNEILQDDPFMKEINQLLKDLRNPENKIDHEEFERRFNEIINNPKYKIFLTPVEKEGIKRLVKDYYISYSTVNTEGYAEEIVNMDEQGVTDEEEWNQRLNDVVQKNGSQELLQLIEVREVEDSLMADKHEKILNDLEENVGPEITNDVRAMTTNVLHISSLQEGSDGMLYLTAHTNTTTGISLPLAISFNPTGNGGYETFLVDSNSEGKGRRFENNEGFRHALEMAKYNMILDRISKKVSPKDVDNFVSDKDLERFVVEFERGVVSSVDPQKIFARMCLNLSKKARQNNIFFGQCFKTTFFSVDQKEQNDGTNLRSINIGAIRNYALRVDQGIEQTENTS